MAALEIIGGFVVASASGFIGYLGAEIAGNIYGGFIGAYRLWRVRHGRKARPTLLFAIRHALHCWVGRRFNGDAGEYYAVGGLKVPLDGRDRIRRKDWWGA